MIPHKVYYNHQLIYNINKTEKAIRLILIVWPLNIENTYLYGDLKKLSINKNICKVKIGYVRCISLVKIGFYM